MSSSTPVNKALYDIVKKNIYRMYKVHSAYRSGKLVQEYKKRFKEKYGNKSPYQGRKPTNTGLTRWYKEDWKADDGKYGYRKKGQVYRPTKRITNKTPITFGELSKNEIKRAKKEKEKTGRVRRFKSLKKEKI